MLSKLHTTTTCQHILLEAKTPAQASAPSRPQLRVNASSSGNTGQKPLTPYWLSFRPPLNLLQTAVNDEWKKEDVTGKTGGSSGERESMKSRNKSEADEAGAEGRVEEER